MPADLPPIGTRWGDLSPEQRASLPVGTVIRVDDWPSDDLFKRRPGAWKRVRGKRNSGLITEAAVNRDRRILSYPEPSNCQ